MSCVADMTMLVPCIELILDPQASSDLGLCPSSVMPVHALTVLIMTVYARIDTLLVVCRRSIDISLRLSPGSPGLFSLIDTSRL